MLCGEIQDKGVCMWLETIYGIVACEAIVQLWFHAAPLQPTKEWVVRITPFLYSKDQRTHLFNCKYCMSVWAGILIAVLYFTPIYLYITLPLTFHRLSNFLHLVFSFHRDKQIDLRINRK